MIEIVFVLIVVLLTSKSSHKHRFVHRRHSIVQLVRAPIRFTLWHKFDFQDCLKRFSCHADHKQISSHQRFGTDSGFSSWTLNCQIWQYCVNLDYKTLKKNVTPSGNRTRTSHIASDSKSNTILSTLTWHLRPRLRP